jgi:O-antigen/teichoic acid export membrane protein
METARERKAPVPQGGSFLSNTLTLMTGTTIAQFIPIAISPILTRIYGPTEFGIFALYTALSSIATSVATARYELAVMLPKNDEDALNIVVLSVVIALSMSLGLFLCVALLREHIASALGAPAIASWLYLLPLSGLSIGIYQAVYYWFNRQKRFKILAMSRVSQSVATSGANIAIGLSTASKGGLIIGGVIGQCLAAVFLGWEILRKERDKRRFVSTGRIRHLAMKYVDYPKKSSLGAFFNTTSYQIEYILFSYLYVLTDIGYYFFINRIVSIPKTFLSTAIWQVFLAENRDKTREAILASLALYQNRLLRVTTLPFFSSLFVITDLFVLIFGENWSASTHYFYPLIIAAHVNLVVSSFSLFVILNRPDMEMVFNILLTFLKISSILLSYYVFSDVFVSIIAISIVQIVMFLFLGSWNYKQLGRSSFHFLLTYLVSVGRISPFVIPLILIRLLTDSFGALLGGVVAVNILNFMIRSNEHSKK